MHTSNGSCLGCAKIFNRYPGFYSPLRDWFFAVQAKVPSFHISCAGRGQVDQEAAFHRKASDAHWLESAHNFNIAIDTFFQINGYCLDEKHYDQISSLIPPEITWYGSPGSKFKELPHFQWTAWRDLVKQGLVHPVE